MSDLLIAKIAAYLIDRAIMLPPQKVASAFDESPNFVQGRPLKSFCEWNDNDLIYISNLFRHYEGHDAIIDGFKGAGVKKDAAGNYVIVLYGDKAACKIIRNLIPSLKSKCRFDISCSEMNDTQFASNGTAGQACKGGICIMQPSGNGFGTLGAWLKRNNTNDRRKIVGVTCNHVAAEYNTVKHRTPIIDRKNREIIGELEHFVKLIEHKNHNKKNNLADIALIRPKKGGLVDFTLKNPPTKPFDECDLEDNYNNGTSTIMLCCENSAKTAGNITAIFPTFYVNHYPQYKFEDVVQIDIGQMGNSGALILDKQNRIGGIFFAVSTQNGRNYGYVNKWEYVKSESGFNFDY